MTRGFFGEVVFPFCFFSCHTFIQFSACSSFSSFAASAVFLFFLHICFLADMQAFRAGNKKFPALFVYLYVDKEDGSIITK